MLQPLTGEESQANCSDKARSDAIAWWFWSEGQWTFFHIRIFDSNSQLYLNKSPRKCYETNEQEKRRKHHKNKFIYTTYISNHRINRQRMFHVFKNLMICFLVSAKKNQLRKHISSNLNKVAPFYEVVYNVYEEVENLVTNTKKSAK